MRCHRYEIVRCLEARGEVDTLVGILDLPDRIPALKEQLGGRFPVVDAIENLVACDPDIIVEAAGHGALRRFGLEIVQRGSVGSLFQDDSAIGARR
jgi:predicted dinucleotide-utilizing enzyme